MNLFSLFLRVSRERLLPLAGVLLVCAAVPMTVPPPVAAQDVHMGIRVGPTFGFLNNSAIPFVSTGENASANLNVRLDIHTGAYATVPLADPFGLQTELLYLRKGGHISRFGDQTYRAERYQLSYLQGQVLSRRDISLPGPLGLHVLMGVTLKRLLSGVVRWEIQTEQQVFQESIDLNGHELVRRWDFGGLVGVGMEYPIGSAGQLAFELRYNPGFRSVFTKAERPANQQLDEFDDPPPLSRFPPSLRHDVITASLAYTVPLGW